MENVSTKRIENLKKSISDKREYLYKELPNKLKVVLISDMEADKSAGALNVSIGSLTDPKEFFGLAHFCEHMLFMGTKKYPKEDEYSDFLNANGGSYNAYTDQDATNYYWEISNQAFDEAVDRFAQFFLEPLFISDVVQREMQAVDSENKKNLQNDTWRFMQLQRSHANPGSVFNRFSTGNLGTLDKPNIRDALLEMHSKYYSSSLMSLVILSNRPLSEIEAKVDSLFKSVPNVEALETPRYDQVPAYDKTNTGFFYQLTPVKDTDQLSFYWWLEDSSKYYKEKPLSFMSSLFGHEGPNSLNSSLMKDDLNSALMSGSDCIANTYSVFYITVTLTKKGLANYKDVIKRVLFYINYIQSKPINERFFEEIKQINQLKFDFKNKENQMSYCSDLSHTLTRNIAPEDLLTGTHVIERYDEEIIKKFINGLTVESMNIYLSSKTLENECTQTEEWYKTKYSKEKLDSSILNKSFLGEKVTEHNIDYPPENVFVPKSLQIKPESENKRKHPEKVLEEDGLVVWYKRDYTFKLPKAIVICQIYLNKNIKHFQEYETTAYLWNSIVENELREISYMASEANVSFKFHFNNEGLYLQLSGFNSSIKNALDELINLFKSISAEDKKDKLKTQIVRHIQEYTNFYLKVPYSQAIAELEYLLVEPSVTAAEKCYILHKGIDIDSMVNFVSKFMDESRFEWLIQGNIQEEEAIEIAKSCSSLIQKDKLSQDKTIIYRTVNINNRTNYIYSRENINHAEENSCVSAFFQCGKLDDKETCLLLVIESLLKDRFFNELRTRQALGYICMLFHREYRNNEGLLCLVQSNVKSPEVLWQRICNFFDDSEKFIKELTDDLFKTHVNSVIVEKKQKDLTLAEEVYRNAFEIKKRQYVFDRKEKHITILEGLKKEELLEFYEDKFVKNVKRIDVQIIAHQHIEENLATESENEKLCQERNINRVKVKSIGDFKRRNSLYPDFFSII